MGENKTDRQADIQAVSQSDRKTERQTGKQTDRERIAVHWMCWAEVSWSFHGGISHNTTQLHPLLLNSLSVMFQLQSS